MSAYGVKADSTRTSRYVGVLTQQRHGALCVFGALIVLQGFRAGAGRRKATSGSSAIFRRVCG